METLQAGQRREKGTMWPHSAEDTTPVTSNGNGNHAAGKADQDQHQDHDAAPTATSANSQAQDQPSTWSEYQDGTDTTDSASRAIAKAVEELDDWLELLTPKQLFVLSRLWGLHDGIEYSEREVAEAMGISQASVQRHHARALKKLRKRVSVSTV